MTNLHSARLLLRHSAQQHNSTTVLQCHNTAILEYYRTAVAHTSASQSCSRRLPQYNATLQQSCNDAALQHYNSTIRQKYSSTVFQGRKVEIRFQRPPVTDLYLAPLLLPPRLCACCCSCGLGIAIWGQRQRRSRKIRRKTPFMHWRARRRQIRLTKASTFPAPPLPSASTRGIRAHPQDPTCSQFYPFPPAPPSAPSYKPPATSVREAPRSKIEDQSTTNNDQIFKDNL